MVNRMIINFAMNKRDEYGNSLMLDMLRVLFI